MIKKISIIVPVYKVEKELDRCVQSLLNQTYKNIEIILVDDGSRDRCSIMCDCYAEKDIRVKTIHKENGGLSDARNAGLKIATGEYILFVDSDDYIEIDSCSKFHEALTSEDIDIVVGNAIMHKSNNNIEMMTHQATYSDKIYTSKEFIIKAVNAHEWYAPAWLNLYRREFLIENNLYYEKGIYFEDMQMLPRVFLKAKKIVSIDYVFYHYIIRENSIMTSKKNEKKQNDSMRIMKQWKTKFDMVEDKEFRKALYGMLARCYLHECRVYKIQKNQIKGLNKRFIIKYGINSKDKIKGILYTIFPWIYVRL